MAGTLIAYYSVYGLFATWLQSDLKLAPAAVAIPVLLSNLVGFASVFFGWISDQIGRRRSIIIQATIGCIVAPAYLLATDFNWIVIGFVIQGIFSGALPCLVPSYMTERFPTEVRSTASGFCYHVGAVTASFVAPLISYFAVEQNLGFARAMLIGTLFGSANVILALLISPETKGKAFVAELTKL
jgi:SHS family lactate transporter-like MFS transporter